MLPQAAWKLGRGGLAATLVLLASALVCPSRAEASCGDYVMIGGRHAGHGAGAPAGNEQMPSPARPGCHGPLCSNNSIPPAAPSPKIEVTVEQWAISGGIELVTLPNHEALPADVHESACDGYGSGILRPPR